MSDETLHAVMYGLVAWLMLIFLFVLAWIRLKRSPHNEMLDGAEIDEELLDKDLRRALKDINFNANKGA